MVEKFDAIVIGSGTGGAGCAAILASKGLKTLLLEKNNVLGGRCTSYVKEVDGEEWIIDKYVHYFCRCEKGPFGKILKEAGEPDAIKWFHPTFENPPLGYLENKPVGAPLPPFLQPQNMKEIQDATGATDEEMAGLLKVFDAIFSTTRRKSHKLDDMTFDAWIKSHLENPKLILMFHTLCVMMNVHLPFDIQYKGKTYKGSSAGDAIRNLSKWFKAGNTGYPLGGSIAISNGFAEVVQKCGGVVLTNSRVININVDDYNKVVELDDNTQYEAPIVISNVGIKETVLKLVGANKFPEDYVEYVKNLIYSEGGRDYGVVSLKIAVDKPLIDAPVILAIPQNLTFKEILDFKARDEVPDRPGLYYITIPSNMDPSLAPPEKQLINAIGPCAINSKHLDDWIEYNLAAVEKYIPGVREHKIFMDVAVGDNIAEWTGRFESDMVGIAQSVGQVGENRPKPETPIEGLYIASADTGQLGIGTELSAQSGFDTAKLVLKYVEAHKEKVKPIKQ
ncbi:MAG: NAD(P)-binding protein [Candidatus Lokiarchaeota archaeon]|nr:NAD(P)-binding protein [Candidatus Lokiarchaeota archaeon]